MPAFRVEEQQTQTTTRFYFPFLHFLKARWPGLDHWASILHFKGSLIGANHALGSQSKPIIGVFHTPTGSLGFPRAFLDSVPGQVLNGPALQLNSGIGD